MWQCVTRRAVARQRLHASSQQHSNVTQSNKSLCWQSSRYKELEGSDPPAPLGSSCQLLATEPTEPLCADTLAEQSRTRRRPPRLRPLLLTQPVSVFGAERGQREASASVCSPEERKQNIMRPICGKSSQMYVCCNGGHTPHPAMTHPHPPDH